MKNIRTLVACLALIIAGILFSTGSAYASGNGSKGGDTACTTQISPYGQPIIRCNAPGGNKQEDASSTPKKHRHYHHHHYYHRHYRYWSHRGHHSYHYGHHYSGYGRHGHHVSHHSHHGHH